MSKLFLYKSGYANLFSRSSVFHKATLKEKIYMYVKCRSKIYRTITYFYSNFSYTQTRYNYRFANKLNRFLYAFARFLGSFVSTYIFIFFFPRLNFSLRTFMVFTFFNILWTLTLNIHAIVVFMMNLAWRFCIFNGILVIFGSPYCQNLMHSWGFWTCLFGLQNLFKLGVTLSA